jgi:hypothetical protein
VPYAICIFFRKWQISSNSVCASSSASNYVKVLQRCMDVKLLSNGKERTEFGKFSQVQKLSDIS